MLLINKSKIVLLFLALLTLTACAGAGGPKTRLMGEAPKQHYDITKKLSVVKDDNIKLSNTDENITNLGQAINTVEEINQRLPVFVLTGNLNSLSSMYGQSICDDLNNDFLNNKYICIIQPLSNLQDSKKYLKKDDLTANINAPFTADFLITRVDYLIDKQKNNAGPLKEFPTLDAVMFLNGSYLYLWGDPKYKSIEFSHFIENFSKDNSSGRRVVIATVNNFAKDLLTKVILANKWNANFEFVVLDTNNPTISKDLHYDIIAYAGATISKGMENYIQNNNKDFTPLNLSDNLISNTQKANVEISTINVADYYSTNDLTNITKVVASLEVKKESHSVSGAEGQNKTSDNHDTEKALNTKNDSHNSIEKNNKLPPLVSGVRYSPGYDKYVFGKSKFDFNVKSVEQILKTDKIVNLRGIKVNTIGIRNVLVATRTTDALKVFNLVSAFLGKYDFMKVNYPTGDMRHFTIRDIIIGGLYDNPLVYHYGITNYVTYAQGGNNNKVSEKESEVINVISRYLVAKNAPPFYGPNMPNGNQISIINEETRKKIIVRQQEKALEGLNSVIEKIRSELELPVVLDKNNNLQNESKKNALDINLEELGVNPDASDSLIDKKPNTLVKEEKTDSKENKNSNNNSSVMDSQKKSDTINELPDDLKELLHSNNEVPNTDNSSNSKNKTASTVTSSSSSKVPASSLSITNNESLNNAFGVNLNN